VSTFVLDASVSLAWFVDHPVPLYAMQVRDAIVSGKRALVPSLWALEMANGLLMAERRGKLTAAEVDHGLRQLEIVLVAGIEIDTVAVPTIREAFTNARSFQLTAYDAVYLDLARRQRLPLATLDKSLRAAAARAGVDAMS
jgi:predicted nucleic acid-binding protein